MLAQSADVAFPELARRRLGRVRAALIEHTDRVGALFAGAGISCEVDAAEAEESAGGRYAVEIESYFHQLHRDWGWDADDSGENQAALRCVTAAVNPERPPKEILVLGAGACRLPIDLHRQVGAALTVALDINPLPFLVVEQLRAGQAVPMYEFPLSPKTSESAAVDRSLRCAGGVPSSFVPVFGDGLDPPVVPGAFDTLFTPWFIDQVPADLRDFITVASRVLPTGGQWINHGPLLYHPERTGVAHRYRQDEVLALLEAGGFEVEYSSWDRLLYMQSPSGSQGRTEGVLTFRAIKRVNTGTPPPPPRSEPQWLTNPDLAIAALPGLGAYVPPHPMFAAVVALIDGRRSTRDIADVLVEKHGLPSDAAVGGVTACLREIVAALRHPGGVGQ